MAANRTKQLYEAKANYVRNLMQRNQSVDGLTPFQHKTLAWLCRVRHLIHTSKEDFWNVEQSDHGQLWDYISDDINNNLSRQELPRINFRYSDIDYITVDTWDIDFNFASRMEAKRFLYSRIEKWNDDIEKYLSKIDTRYGTEYCPTGTARLD